MKQCVVDVIVDMQNDFVTGSLGTAEAQAITPGLAAEARRAAGTGPVQRLPLLVGPQPPSPTAGGAVTRRRPGRSSGRACGVECGAQVTASCSG